MAVTEAYIYMFSIGVYSMFVQFEFKMSKHILECSGWSEIYPVMIGKKSIKSGCYVSLCVSSKQKKTLESPAVQSWCKKKLKVFSGRSVGVDARHNVLP